MYLGGLSIDARRIRAFSSNEAAASLLFLFQNRKRACIMKVIVIKFGGSSLSTPDKIRNAAERILEEKRKGYEVTAVVSAMGKTTDQLVELAGCMSKQPSKREMDMLLATGEQVSIALLSMALSEMGSPAVSYTGWQAGIITEQIHSSARIIDVHIQAVRNQLEAGKAVVVAGFQGVCENGDITTLGRGGSDTTAVALAAALGAERCMICTDVDGVYTSDPRYVKNARKLASVSYDEMLELAHLGAGVLHPRAVEFAKNYRVSLEVCSSQDKVLGTMIEEAVSMEKNLVVRGVAFEDRITRVSISGLRNEMTGLSAVFTALAKSHIDVDIIIQSREEDGKTSLAFTINEKDVSEAADILEKGKEQIGYDHIEYESGLAKVSIVGSGMVSNPGVAAQMFDILAKRSICVKMVSTSEIKVSVVIDKEHMERAASLLHDTFGLAAAEKAAASMQ